MKENKNRKLEYQFLLFLSMNNYLHINTKTSISDYVCSEYMNIFLR